MLLGTAGVLLLFFFLIPQLVGIALASVLALAAGWQLRTGRSRGAYLGVAAGLALATSAVVDVATAGLGEMDALGILVALALVALNAWAALSMRR